MSDETIPPALTAEEWARAARSIYGDIPQAADVYRDAILYDGAARWDGPGAATAAHGLAALANAALPAGDPRKIAPEDVALLRLIAEASFELDGPRSETGARIAALAAKLAALLPPREVGP
jgi:hypothetical protein